MGLGNKKLIIMIKTIFHFYKFFLPILIFSTFTSNHIIANSEYDENELWNALIKSYLNDTLWCDEYKYDAAYDLMVLMHDAFQSKNRDRIEMFHNHFSNFINESASFKGNNRTHDLQYMYFASQYLLLTVNYGFIDEQSDEIFHLLREEIEDIWLKEKFRVANTDIKKYFYYEGLKKRLEWKLNDEVYRKVAPFKAIIDIENFTFAIAADLKFINNKMQYVDEQLFSDILALAYKIFNDRVTYINDSIWYTQLGYRDERRDYQYSGYKSKGDIKKPNAIKNIAPDVNHFQRMPLWLLSLKNGDDKNSSYYNRLHNYLEKMFIRNIIVFPDEKCKYIRVNNFVDGNNGLYRWNYNTLKEGEGYGPFDLSYSFLHGWYTFIKKESVRDVFRILNNQFPIPKSKKHLYVDKTQREQHPVIKNGLENGLYWLISNSASRIE